MSVELGANFDGSKHGEYTSATVPNYTAILITSSLSLKALEAGNFQAFTPQFLSKTQVWFRC